MLIPEIYEGVSGEMSPLLFFCLLSFTSCREQATAVTGYSLAESFFGTQCTVITSVITLVSLH